MRTDPQDRCDNEASVLDSFTPAPGATQGDLDDDGRSDRVQIVHEEAAPPGCGSFLIAITSEVTFSAPVDPAGEPRALEEPSILGVTDVDERPGDEVVMLLETGASTQFAGVFTLTTSGLERLTLEGRGPGPFATEESGAALFPFGGSVGHVEAVDCAPAGGIVMSAATPAGASAESYRVERRYFRSDGTRLVLDRSATEREVVEGLDLGNFPEFRGSPFLSCD